MKTKNVVALSSLLAIGVVATAAHATSRYVGALAGTALNVADQACFTDTNGQGKITNTGASSPIACSGSQLWDIPLPIDSTGNLHSALIYMNVPSPVTGSQCRLIASSPTLTGGGGTTFQNPSSASSWQPVGIGSIQVPISGFLYADCVLAPNASLTSVIFDL